MKRLLILLAVFALSGCKPSAEKAIELAKNEIAADMKDPDSAKFRYLRFVDQKETAEGDVVGMICGQVNAKNAFGAYVGFHPFIIEISMKSKGIFSKSVIYKTPLKLIFREGDIHLYESFKTKCGPDQ